MNVWTATYGSIKSGPTHPTGQIATGMTLKACLFIRCHPDPDSGCFLMIFIGHAIISCDDNSSYH